MISFKSKLPTKQKAEYGSLLFYNFKKMEVGNCCSIATVKSTRGKLCINQCINPLTLKYKLPHPVVMSKTALPVIF